MGHSRVIAVIDARPVPPNTDIRLVALARPSLLRKIFTHLREQRASYQNPIGVTAPLPASRFVVHTKTTSVPLLLNIRLNDPLAPFPIRCAQCALENLAGAR